MNPISIPKGNVRKGTSLRWWRWRWSQYVCKRHCVIIQRRLGEGFVFDSTCSPRSNTRTCSTCGWNSRISFQPLRNLAAVLTNDTSLLLASQVDHSDLVGLLLQTEEKDGSSSGDAEVCFQTAEGRAGPLYYALSFEYFHWHATNSWKSNW